MTRVLAVPSLLAMILGFGVPGDAAANTVLAGDDGQAFYKIVVPDGWNGDLVVWNHGFSLSPVGPVSDLGPLAPLQLAEGYAVAASSFQMPGWAVLRFLGGCNHALQRTGGDSRR